MDTHTVTHIENALDEDEANRYLDAGWVLLATGAGYTEDSDRRTPYFTYSMGWPKAGEPARPAPRAEQTRRKPWE
jgi:hypothetical protein